MIDDFLLPGSIGLRLVDAPAAVLRSVAVEVGPADRTPLDAPDLTIRFVDELPRDPELRALGLRQAAFDREAFYLLDEGGHRSRMALDLLGEPIEIVCERGVVSIPLLREAIDLRLLATGRVLLHSAAATVRGRTVLVAGWQKGGKSEILLSLMASGAVFLADEWTVVDPVARTVAGLGDRLFVWDWHLAQLPAFRGRLPLITRLRLRSLGAYRDLYGAAVRRLARPGSGPRPGSDRFPFRLLRRAALPGAVPLLGQVHPSPGVLFGSDRAGSATLDAVVLANVAVGPSRARPIPSREVADRMVASQAYERRHLLDAYAAFRFAFPERRNLLLESAAERERGLLTAAFDGLPAHEVVHPYPVDLRALGAVVTAALFDPAAGSPEVPGSA